MSDLALENMTVAGLRVPSRQIKVVRTVPMRVSSSVRDELLRQADFMEAQANRLTKMAREMRAMVMQLTIE